MGLRGPLRDADSTRGARQARSQVAALPTVMPDPPVWLNPDEKKLFRTLVEDAIAANGPVLRVDALVFANIARLQLALQKERHGNTAARMMRTLLPWMQAAGLTAVGRARLGVKQVEKKKSVTSQLLEMTKRPA